MQLAMLQHKYVDDMLKEYDIIGQASSPALEDLFIINVESESLSKDEATTFHSRVAKILYYAKRIRGELLPAMSYLSSRVTRPTRDDCNKLERVFKYINSTKRLATNLSISNDLKALVYADASFAVHADMKSQSGIAVSLGAGTVYLHSSKQKLVSKSSTVYQPLRQ